MKKKKNCCGKQRAGLFSVGSLHYKCTLLLFKTDFYIWQSLLFQQKLLLSAHRQFLIWQTRRKAEGAGGREKEVVQDTGQIPATPLKMAQDLNAPLLFEAGFRSNAPLRSAGSSAGVLQPSPPPSHPFATRAGTAAQPGRPHL